MNHAINRLTTQADIDSLLESAIAEKEDLAYRRSGLIRKFQAANNQARDIDSALAIVEAELAALLSVKTAVYQGALFNDVVKSLDKAKTRAESKRVLLTSRKAYFDAFGLVQKENSIDRLQDDISKVEAFIAALTKRKQHLPGSRTKTAARRKIKETSIAKKTA